MKLTHGDKTLDLTRPQVMGVLNVTPDSFSDGGRHNDPDAAVAQANAMLAAGATLIDVGGESTRPGAQPVSLAEELRRVLPVVEAVRRHTDAWISVDTSSPEVMVAAVEAGADMLNDVRAFTRPGALAQVAALQVPVCLMHMQGEPDRMQNDPRYSDVVNQVMAYLGERAVALRAAGVPSDRIVVDPGFGFGKTLAHNLDLLNALPMLSTLGYPVLVGMSRKSMIGDITGRPVAERTAGSVAAAMLAVQHGAAIVRVHDVAETVDALAIQRAAQANKNNGVKGDMTGG